MAKIIEITDTVISIGMDNGTIEEVRANDINFVPHIGDEVELFKTETKVIVSKGEKKPDPAIPQGGININLTNSQDISAPAQTVVAPINGKAVNKTVYCLLAFFLGGIGIHKFYAGRTGSGILCLLFCWTGIPSIIALVDFIVGLTKRADVNGIILV